MQDSYKVIFDGARTSVPDVTLPVLVGASLFVVGLLALIVSREGRGRLVLTVEVLIVVLGLSLVAGPLVTKWKFRQFIKASQAGHYDVVEGIVTNFRPMPESGHGQESFDVDGRHFAYSDFVDNPGFHQTRSKGGPIQSGLRVRIYCWGNCIARLEIADSKGGYE